MKAVYGALVLGLGLSGIAQAETLYSYCMVEKDYKMICKAPEEANDDAHAACRDYAKEIRASRWGLRSSASLAALSADMGAHCEEMAEGSSGALFACGVLAQCPDSSSEHSGPVKLGNYTYAAQYPEALQYCHESNQRKLLGALSKYSLADCFVKVIAAVRE